MGFLKRNTPTSVGKTSFKRRERREYRKHPHERGEDECGAIWTTRAKETPPRAWGRRPDENGADTDNGNTPTSVGKTSAHDRHDARLEKHPHERGEDLCLTGMSACITETPPRAWGRPPFSEADARRIGNTPTSVGKTASCSCLSKVNRKHPHERGEDGGDHARRSEEKETPPRAWGRRPCAVVCGSGVRNTPTSVGKTARIAPIGDGIAKHPHERGEDQAVFLTRCPSAETPPRAWGRRLACCSR